MKSSIQIYPLGILFLLVSCSQQPAGDAKVVKRYPIEGKPNVLTTSNVDMDLQITSDGNGALRITLDDPQTIRLYETGDIDVENARLLYSAKLRTENLDGQAYLEMWCHFAGKGDFFSRALHDPLTGTTDWTTQETPFFLKTGENPDNVKLNVVINGKGTVWVDDIQLVRGPLQ